MKKEKKFDCYGYKIIFNEDTCTKDNCKWLVPCKLLCGYKIDMFSYKLAGELLKVITRSETIEILMKHYGISYNASKMAIKRWKKKQI